ncbi:MAG: TetR/AcrR family transcriptional regulator [Phaeodactylibacter sp.]|nr:TetR/AcrR family transcriptional regulator [Phaeodactylibacter sp.]
MELTTEEKIRHAARKVFTSKGFAAARMQEIADEAEINKGLLHYYYRSKKKLFQAIFDEAFTRFSSDINQVFGADIPLFEKIEQFVDRYISMVIVNPELPGFIINELNQKGEAFIQEILSRQTRPNPMPLITQIQAEAEAGRIRPINPAELFLNILSLCLFPFLARPMFQGMTGINNETYEEMMRQRKQEVAKFVIDAIKQD